MQMVAICEYQDTRKHKIKISHAVLPLYTNKSLKEFLEFGCRVFYSIDEFLLLFFFSFIICMSKLAWVSLLPA